MVGGGHWLREALQALVTPELSCAGFKSRVWLSSLGLCLLPVIWLVSCYLSLSLYCIIDEGGFHFNFCFIFA